jgi:fluoride ion exporter CrcB/FEX
MKNHRKEYFAVTLAIFLTGFFAYGLIVLFAAEELISGNKILDVLMFGVLGGYLLGSILSGFYLLTRFLGNKSLRFKVLCAVFFAITITITMWVGVFGFIPYGIYNLVRMKSDK